MDEINDLQFAIMVFVKQWANVKKTTVPQREIIKNLQIYGVKSYTVLNAIKALIDKGYIRKSCEQDRKTFYVMIRNIEIKSDYSFKWIPNKHSDQKFT